MSDWLKDCNEARGELRSVAYMLFALAESLAHVGQSGLAEDVRCHAEKVGDAEGVLNAAIGEAVDEICHSAREASLNVVNTALAALRLERKGVPR